MRFRGGENENDMGRRLLQGFQQGVEGLVRKHVHFIDDIDFVLVFGGKVFDVLPELPDFVDPAVRGPVDFQHVDGNSIPDLLTGGAPVAGLRSGAFLAVESFGKDSGYRCLPDAAGSGKKVRMGHPSRGNGILQSLGDRPLPHDLLKGAGPPFPR